MNKTSAGKFSKKGLLDFFFNSKVLPKLVCCLFLFFFLGNKIKAQNKLEGFVFDSGSKLPVPNALISVNKIKITSDSSGRYQVNLKKGHYDIIISSLGYDDLRTSIEVYGTTRLESFLIPKSAMMNEVVVTAQSNRLSQASPPAEEITAKDLEKVPFFLGQKDPVRTLQTLPGTGKGGDGNSGFFVRGGTAGQNLTLFNQALIYNPSHLLGFFSVFNGDAVHKIKLYKSGIPSEYGGRLSSVVEVSSDTKVADTLSIKGDVSLIAADATFNIPVTKNWSVNASLRKTFMNATIWPLINKLSQSGGTFNNTEYDFYDVILGSNLRVNSKNHLAFSSFMSGDNFRLDIGRFNIGNTMDWTNSAHSMSWKRTFAPNINLNTVISRSTYNFDFGMFQDRYKAGVSSEIKDYSVKSYALVHHKSHTIKAGIEYLKHKYKPNAPFASTAETAYDFGSPNTYYSDESSVFISDELFVSDKAGIYTGIRYTLYRHLGPYSYLGEDNNSVSYTKNSIVSSKVFLEPSVTFNYKVRNNTALKFAFSRNVQPVHLISVTAVNFPADFWMPSAGGLKPQKGYQGSAGLFLDVNPNKYEASIDFYYKKMTGLTEFSGGIMNLIDNLKIEENLYFGKGNAFGAEFFLKKKFGNLTGWISYTWSKNNRSFPSINQGESFPAKYDRRHDLSAVSSYNLNKRWLFSGTFTYATGNTYTAPVSRFMLAGNIVNGYGPYNGSRMPAYHRLDLSAAYSFRSKSKLKNQLVFSVYNVYSRLNPIYIYFMAEGDLAKYQISVTPKSVSILPVLPSISYRYTF